MTFSRFFRWDVWTFVLWNARRNEKRRLLSRQLHTPLDFGAFNLFPSLSFFPSLYFPLPSCSLSQGQVANSALSTYLFESRPSVPALIARRRAVDYFIFHSRGCRLSYLHYSTDRQTDACYATANIDITDLIRFSLQIFISPYFL